MLIYCISDVDAAGVQGEKRKRDADDEGDDDDDEWPPSHVVTPAPPPPLIFDPTSRPDATSEQQTDRKQTICVTDDVSVIHDHMPSQYWSTVSVQIWPLGGDRNLKNVKTLFTTKQLSTFSAVLRVSYSSISPFTHGAQSNIWDQCAQTLLP